MDESGPESDRKVGNMEDLFEKSEPEATAASHLSGLKILDGVPQIAIAHSTTSFIEHAIRVLVLNQDTNVPRNSC